MSVTSSQKICKRLNPGAGNHNQYSARGLQYCQTTGDKDKHLKLLGGPRTGHSRQFGGMAPTSRQTPQLGRSIEVAYTIELNIWNDGAKIQLDVVNLKFLS
jgi:hypothetical protein